MNKNKKKLAFTLVELLVVIAILAVLAAVAIIGYSSFIDKAYESNDTGVITELNHYLKAANPLDEKVPTATDAARLLQGSGLNIAELKPSKDDSFYGYNYEKKEFVIVKAPLQDNANNIKIFVFVKDQETMASVGAKHYSVYLQKDFKYATENTQKELTVNYGIDVGENKDTSVINYTSSENHSVVICTNSYNTVLTVSAPNDVVNHYGKANKVDVNSVKPSSYHENGDVLGNITLKNGRVVVEEGAKANAVYVDATAEAINAGTAVVSADNSDAPEVPIILRDVVKDAADTKGGNNSIPNPAVQYVIVLSDKVTSDETKNAVATLIKADKTIINYESLQEALNAMIPDSTVLLLADIENSPILRLDKSVAGNYKIDLNGHSITFTTEGVASDEMAFEIEGAGSYAICNGTLNCYSSAYGDVLETYCNTTLNNITINFEDASGARWGAIYTGASEMVMNSCYINAISGPGIQNGNKNAKLIINDSTIISADHSALYCSGASITEVNNSVVSGARAIHACTSGATFYINSGTFVGTQYAIQLDNTDKSVDWQGEPNYAGCSFAFVYGGNFVGGIKLQDRPAGHGVAELYVFGGTFDHDVSQYLVNN